MITKRYQRWTFDTEEEANSFASLKEQEGCEQVQVKPLIRESRIVGFSTFWMEESTD